jgi:hypothetical protein
MFIVCWWKDEGNYWITLDVGCDKRVKCLHNEGPTDTEKGTRLKVWNSMGALIVSPQRKWPPGLPDHCSIHLFQKHHVYAYVLCHASKTPSSILVTVNHREWSLNVCSVDPTPSSHKMNFFFSVPPLQTLALISFMHCNIPHMQHYAKQVYYTLRDS